MEDPNPVENIDRLGDLMFQTSDKSQLLRRVLWINAQLTIVWSLKHKISQPIYIFNRENAQNSESPNGPRRGLDFIALHKTGLKLTGPMHFPKWFGPIITFALSWKKRRSLHFFDQEINAVGRVLNQFLVFGRKKDH